MPISLLETFIKNNNVAFEEQVNKVVGKVVWLLNDRKKNDLSSEEATQKLTMILIIFICIINSIFLFLSYSLLSII